MDKFTLEKFIEISNKTHNNKYDYSKTVYVNSKIKLEIICPEHGSFYPRPDHHMKKTGCPICSKINVADSFRKSLNQYIKDCKKIHNNTYDYSLVDYKNSQCYIKVICPEHGEFKIRADHHRRGQGCKKCSDIKSSLNQKKDVLNFIQDAKNIHENKYDYSLVNYINNYTKIKIICPQHGIFEQKPHDHTIHKSGCPICNESKGEREIKIFLNKININFIQQHKFNDCVNINSLPFDFYLPKHKICIEYDGKQHFEPIDYFGGQETFEKLQTNDNIKNQYCINNKIGLIRISYKDDPVEILNKYFILK